MGFVFDQKLGVGNSKSKSLYMFTPDLTKYPYLSTRPVIMGTRGAVATSQPLAAMAGMEMLCAGGNAVDAAVAMAIALTVVEPTSNGIGSDAFAFVWDGQLHSLNASGFSPQKLLIEHFQGLTAIPRTGWHSVTVPGAVSSWRTLWERWGRLPFEQLFAPAIRYAEEGFPVSPVTSLAWKLAESIYLPLTGAEFAPFQQLFFPNHRAPAAGEIWHSAAHASTLREIAQTGGESFYRGRLAEQITNFAANTGGYLSKSDLAAHEAHWVKPISTDYRGVTVWELPPNTQGIAALIALNIISGFDLSSIDRESPESYHLQIEAMKLALADLYKYIADPTFLKVSPEHLLSLDYAAERRALIGDLAIAKPLHGLPKGGTVYLAAADGELMVSFIQSNYLGFGSGIVPEGTGIALQNRACGFSLEAEHPNLLAPGKRPFHTIIPGFLTIGNQPLGPFGVMGAAMQSQGHVQVVVNLADYHMNPQAALDAPRWRCISDGILLEPSVAPSVLQGLQQRGHNVHFSPEGFFGRGQMVLKHSGVLLAASESRADGLAIAW